MLASPAVATAGPGDGFRYDGWVIHPSVDGSIAYQTNVHLLADPNAVDHPDDWITRIVPQVSAERVGGRAHITFLALYDWRAYAYHPELDAKNNFEIGAATAIDEDRELGFGLEDRVRVQSRPSELETLGQYQRISNTARLSSAYRPGPALEVRPSIYSYYDHFSEGRTSLAERYTTGVAADARWAFLSRTVWVVDGEGGAVNYTQSIAQNAPVTNTPVNSGSTYWRAETGLVGQLTSKINVALKAGYGQAIYKHNESLTGGKGFTATAKAEWTPRATSLVSAGYERSFEDVFFTNFAVIDRLFAKEQQQLGGEWRVDGIVVGEWQDYSLPFSRRDFVMRIEPTVRRRLRDWADIGFDYTFERRWSRLGAQPAPGTFDPESSYLTQRFELTANLQW